MLEFIVLLLISALTILSVIIICAIIFEGIVMLTDLIVVFVQLWRNKK